MRLLVSALALLLLTGCATGKDAVARGGDFQFVAPGGKDVITYDPPSARGVLRTFGGESLTEPGRQIGIQDYPGKVVVINIWGSWCGPCRAEMADLQLVSQQQAARGVVVLGLNQRDSREAAADFARNTGATYPSIYDPPGRALFVLSGYPRNVVPSTILLDREHRVAEVFLRRVRPGELTEAVQRLAAEPAPS